MSKGLRLSEKWFQRGLWLIALIFAAFLIGLGNLVIGDLPRVEKTLRLDDFLDTTAAVPLQTERDALDKARADNRSALEKAELDLGSARNDVAQARASFDQWVATRSATEQSAQKPEVLKRTRQLDALGEHQRDAQRKVETLRQQALTLRQQADRVNEQLDQLNVSAGQQLTAAAHAQALRVFGIRLALTLPLLVVAGWLFVRKRKSAYWPFVWGFIFFALFAFFVELVPYLPSYGGYVRYLVGLALTLAIGHYAIRALQRYLERQRDAERQPDAQRRESLDYEAANARLAKKVCPGCERPVDLQATAHNFCMHCGICLFNICAHCSTRKSAFARFCHACGTSAVAPAAPGEPQTRAT